MQALRSILRNLMLLVALLATVQGAISTWALSSLAAQSSGTTDEEEGHEESREEPRAYLRQSSPTPPARTAAAHRIFSSPASARLAVCPRPRHPDLPPPPLRLLL